MRPLTGSSAPFTHASWWLPRITHWSGFAEPRRTAITSRAGARLQSNASLSRTVAGAGPRGDVVGRPPRPASGGKGAARARGEGRAVPDVYRQTRVFVWGGGGMRARPFH